LKNRNKNYKILEEDIVKNTQEKNIVFILVATPVEEVYFVNSIQGLIFAIRITPILIVLPRLFVKLLSACLIIDEVDDFDGRDLIAIGRLIHHAGMLGRKVMISSATITRAYSNCLDFLLFKTVSKP
jgi:CRISPR/Cas system-associated endonuclease/helicase Cas3